MKRLTMNFSSMLIAAAALLGACHSDDPTESIDDKTVHIATRVSGQDGADGSANINSYKPENGTPLFLYYGEMGSAASVKYVYNATGEGSWDIASGAPLYWDNLQSREGIYPFFAASPQTPNASQTVATDQNAADAYRTSDQLIAYASTSGRKVQLNLNLHHVLSQLQVSITSAAGDNQLDLSGATLAIEEAKLSYSLAYTAPTTDSPATATATGKAQTLTPRTDSRAPGSAAAASTAAYTAIVPPQSTRLRFVFTIKGKTYTYVNTEKTHELKPGESTRFEFTASKSGVELSSIKLTDWKNAGTAVQADVTVKLEGEASGAGDGQATISGTSMNIWKKTDNAETDKGYAHPYDKGTDNKWSSSNPIYVDDTNIGTDHFYATIDNGTGAITGVVDLIGAGPATMGKGMLNFGFTHLMAQLAVNLTKGTDFPADVDLSAATVSTPSLKTAYTLSYDGSGSALMVNAKADGASTAYSGLATGVSTAAAINGETAYLVVPQTIAQGATFTVSAGDKTYTGTLSQAMTLQAGKKNVLTLTLNPTGMTVGNITLTDWTRTNQDGSAKVDGVDDVTTALTDIDRNGTLHLVATANGTPATNGHGTYPVTYDAGKKEATVNTKDATYTPILWDHLAKGNYIYRALFVPTDHSNDASAGDGNNHELDYLTGTSASTDWGTSPDFNSENTKLKHALNQFTVVLESKDKTFSETELKSATVTTVSKAAPSVNPANGTLTIVTVSGKTVTLLPHTGSLTKTAIIAPQTLDDIVISIPIGGEAKTYTVKPDAGIILKAGEHYTFTVNIKRSETDFTVGQTPWIPTEGDGGDISIDK